MITTELTSFLNPLSSAVYCLFHSSFHTFLCLALPASTLNSEPRYPPDTIEFHPGPSLMVPVLIQGLVFSWNGHPTIGAAWASNSQPTSPSCSFLREILRSSPTDILETLRLHLSSTSLYFMSSIFSTTPLLSTSSLKIFSVVRWFLQLHHCVSPSFQCLPIAPPFLTTFTTLYSPKSLCARSRQLRFQLNIFPAPFCTFLYLSRP